MLDGLYQARRGEDPSGRSVSDRTWRDLSLDDVFARLDRCRTVIGRQTLYRRLRRGRDAEPFGERVEAFQNDSKLVAAFEGAVKPLRAGDAGTLAPLLWGDAPALPRGARLFPFATAATVLAAAATLVWPVALFAVLGLVIGNIAIRLHLHHLMSLHADALATLAKLLASADRLAALDHPAIRPELDGMRLALGELAPFRRSLSWATLETRSLNDLVASVVVYLNVLFLLDVNAFASSMRLLHRGKVPLQGLFDTVGELDAAQSVASFREETTHAVPALGRRGAPIVVTGMRHPLVPDAVPNDVVLARSGWLVLGSNMSGKSTCLKAIALQAVLAQAIFTVTCDGYAAPPLTVRTLIHVEDDLDAGKSHFHVEAEAARDMLVEEHEETDRLCIVDELFRGTNTEDRIAAGTAVLRGLHRRGVHVVAATHDAELIDRLAPDFEPYHFAESVEGGAITFDYRLRHGAAAPRNAIAVLAMVGVPEDVLTEARVYRRA